MAEMDEIDINTNLVQEGLCGANTSDSTHDALILQVQERWYKTTPIEIIS